MRRIFRAIARNRGSGTAAVHVFEKVRREIRSLKPMWEPEIETDLRGFASENLIERLLAKALSLYGHELEAVRWWARLRNERSAFPDDGMYDWMEAQILYLLIRCEKPQVVVEISPHYGYSTGFILLAMNQNNLGRLFSFDLEERFHEHALRNFSRVGIDPSRQSFYSGNVREEYERVLPDRIDLLFMDSDHSYAFAEWYIAHLYPRVAEDGLIHAHDVLKYGIKPHLGDKGEGKALWDFIRRRQIPETEFLYVSRFVRNQPTKPEILQKLERYPFGETSMATNNIEQNAALWIIRRL